MAIAGLRLIVPSSVSAGGSATASITGIGKVEITGLTSTDQVVVEDAFSSLYDNYLIVSRHSGGGGEEVRCELRVGGSNTTTGYTRQSLSANNSSISGARGATNGFPMAHATDGADHCWVYGPYLAQPTATRTINVRGGATTTILDLVSTQSGATSFTGFNMRTTGATALSIKFCIYGLAQ